MSNGLTFSTSYAVASAWMMQRYGFQHADEEIAQERRQARSRATRSRACRSAKANGGAAIRTASSTRCSAGGSSTGRPHPDRPADRLRQCPTGRHVDGWFQQGLRAARRGEPPAVHPAEDIIDNSIKAFQPARLRRLVTAPSARRPDVRGAGRRRIPRSRAPAMSHAPGGERAEAGAVRPEHGEAHEDPRQHELRVPRRDAQRVQRAVLQHRVHRRPAAGDDDVNGPAEPYANFNNGSYPAANAVAGASASTRLTSLLATTRRSRFGECAGKNPSWLMAKG